MRNSSKKVLTDKAITYLQTHCNEKYSLNEMACALFVNKNYLARTFRQVTGTTPLQYHNRLRCEEAARLLADPHYTIAGVAFRTGFTSASHFSRVFKTYQGCTPSDYRRQLSER